MTNYSVFVVDDEGVAREGVTLALKREYRHNFDGFFHFPGQLYSRTGTKFPLVINAMSHAKPI